MSETETQAAEADPDANKRPRNGDPRGQKRALAALAAQQEGRAVPWAEDGADPPAPRKGSK